MGIALDQAGQLLSAFEIDRSHVQFDLQHASAPGDLYVTDDDVLVIVAYNIQAGANVRVSYRHLAPDGSLRLNTLEMTPAADGLRHESRFPLAEGYILALSAYSTSATLPRGNLFIQVGLLRGGIAGIDYVQLLLSDYLTQNVALGFPWPILRSPLEGPGFLQIQAGMAPAAGTDILQTVPDNISWRLFSFSFNLTTSAAVANRHVRLDFTRAGVVGWSTPALLQQAASTTWGYIFSRIGSAYETTALGNRLLCMPLPQDIRLRSADRILTATANLQPGDQFTAPNITYERLFDV